MLNGRFAGRSLHEADSNGANGVVRADQRLIDGVVTAQDGDGICRDALGHLGRDDDEQRGSCGSATNATNARPTIDCIRY